MSKNHLTLNQLGAKSPVFDEYHPDILEKISRKDARTLFSCDTSKGFDIWRFYEFTFLNSKAIPQTAMGIMTIPANSPFTVESKSLKLYLGSFTNTKFADLNEVSELISHDLKKLLKTDLKVSLFPVNAPEAAAAFKISALYGTLIDESLNDANDAKFAPILELKKADPKLLVPRYGKITEEYLCSQILRTLCPVTGQPDFASVVIHYQGFKVNYQDLLAYLISFRSHQGFHEHCTEKIYHDLKTRLKLDKVGVTAMFTRRGGIDINPVRSDFELDCQQIIRHLRQ